MIPSACPATSCGRVPQVGQRLQLGQKPWGVEHLESDRLVVSGAWNG
jgi:hypothetical protein